MRPAPIEFQQGSNTIGIDQCVNVVTMTEKGDVWISERIKTKDQRGVLNFPGGDCNLAEQPRDAAIRELKEETDIYRDKNDAIFLGRQLAFRNNKPYQSTSFLIILREDETPRNTEPHKHGPWTKLPATQVLQMPPEKTLPGTQAAILRALNTVNQFESSKTYTQYQTK